MASELDAHVGAYQGNNIYDFDNEILLTWYPKRVLEITGGKGALLELGLGHGYTTNIFSKAFSRHIVIDGSPAVIREFRQKHPNCSAKIVEALFEEFSSEIQFDIIVMGFVLEHVEDPALILRSYQKYLKPGGRIFVAVPNAEVLNRRLGLILGMLDKLSCLSGNDLLLGHRRYYTMSTLKQELAEAGLALTKIEGIYLKPFSTSQMVSLNLDKATIDALCLIGTKYPELCCGLLAEAAVP